ncbi:MAG TPA: 2-amino-4-hydroxy-6-hydroxymethyldihydropteridine diphosphokinase [Candidatus Cloacimonadota bacterium]|nr:2-amino-4-hydroxy-6-hydroxymethyldihydropteridine diphosphokinase [Candidatus Cloacimonadota bacterium]HPT71518.1 2-amino-4-hydroxy-6-hydroxymethyldihydropteridine diphosphokinase [Candidatus Cloacimonadota bacterium]
MRIVYIGLGSNIGEREIHLRKALEGIAALPSVAILDESAVLESKPYGYTEQEDFLNQVVRIMTDLEPSELFEELKNIEKKLGRTETFRWGPRVIDLDILFVDDLVYQDELITVPHPGATQREFVLQPMVEIAPNYIDPISGKSMKRLLAELRGETMPQNDPSKITEIWHDNETKPVATIILAAGKGTRMKSEKAKVTFQLAEKSLVQRVVDTASELDSEIICVVVGYQKESVMDSLEPNEKIRFVEQKEQNGTGHAVMVTEPVFQDFRGDVFILCGDVPLLKAETLQNLLKAHRESGSACTVLTYVMDDPALYGRIIRHPEKNHVEKIVEYKDASDVERAIQEINTGIYCFDAPILFKTLKLVNNHNKQHEYYLTDTLEILNSQGAIVSAVLLENFLEASGINSQQQLSELEVAYYDEIKEHWLNNGVVIENPCSVIIGEHVKIEHDTIIEANTIIKGETQIGKNCRIGCNSYIKDAILEEDVILKGYNIIQDATLGKGDFLDFGETVMSDEE